MRKELTVLAILALVFSPLAAASIHCPCLKPGAKGTIIKFLAREGTTTNVTLYPMEESLSIGGVLQIYAGKTVGNDTLVIENLTITLYVNSVLKSETKTDSGGKAEFRIVEPGDYLFIGGDANATVKVGGVEEVTMVVWDNETASDNQTAGTTTEDNNSTGGGGDDELIEDGTESEPNNAEPPQKKAPAPQDLGLIYLAAFALIILIAFAVFMKKPKKSKKK